MLRTKLTLLLVLLCFLSGCVRNIPLDTAKAERIDRTEVYLCKLQDSLKMPGNRPAIYPGFDPATLIVGTVVLSTLVGIWHVREKAAFAPIKEDLADYSLEQKLSESMSCALQENKHFNFSDIKVVKIEEYQKHQEILQLLENSDSRYVAFIFPEYTLLPNMDVLHIDSRLSVYDKNDVVPNKIYTKLPKPIYQTKANYQYTLPNRGWFSHVGNSKRLKANNSKLLIETLDDGVAKISEQLTTNAAKPMVG